MFFAADSSNCSPANAFLIFAVVSLCAAMRTEFRLPSAHFKALLANRAMNIHEYQAKELLEKFGVATTRGRVASTLEEAEAIARELAHGKRDVVGPRIWSDDAAPPKDATSNSGAQPVDLVVKAQVHAGGRGKGTFKN